MKVFIPFRDRRIDPRRGANLEVVQAWWYAHGYEPVIVDDGLSTLKDGTEPQFNRHRAYNRAIEANPDLDVFIFTEADMLIYPRQVDDAVNAAVRRPGLVVPFSQYRYLGDSSTAMIRDLYHDADVVEIGALWNRPPEDPWSLFECFRPESVMDNGTSTGAVNVVSRETLEITGGYTEITSGNWYDDRIIEKGFAFLTGTPTRIIDGPAVHLYHLPGWKGDHLTDEDRAATAHNKVVLDRMRHYIKHRDKVAAKSLLSYRRRR